MPASFSATFSSPSLGGLAFTFFSSFLAIFPAEPVRVEVVDDGGPGGEVAGAAVPPGVGALLPALAAGAVIFRIIGEYLILMSAAASEGAPPDAAANFFY